MIGFSRGAAGARAFVHKLVNEWASQKLIDKWVPPGGRVDKRAGNVLGFMHAGPYVLPYQVNFMGLFDTVASVSLPDSFRTALNSSGISGHSRLNSWPFVGSRQTTFAKGGAMNIPAQVRACYHAFSIHEQRMSFPLDSIRKGPSYPEGDRIEVAYPGVHSDVGGGYGQTDCTNTVLHPGVHSDVGGGYGPGAQGKACNANGQGVDARKLSQIPLHDMYIAALEHGVPLMTADEMRGRNVAEDFRIDPAVIKAFNAWLKTTTPVSNLKDAMTFGMGQLLTWRAQIGTGDYVTQRPFYKFAHEDGMTPHQITEAVEKKKATDPQYQKLSRQLAEAKAGRGDVSYAPNMTRFIPGIDKISIVSEANAKINDIQIAQARRIAELAGKIAHPDRPNTGRPGDEPGDICTNDKTDLRQGAEEMRLLLGHLYPFTRKHLQVNPILSTLRPISAPFIPVVPIIQTFQKFPDMDREKPCESPRLYMVEWSSLLTSLMDTVLKVFNVLDDRLLKPVEGIEDFAKQHTSDEAINALRKQPAAIDLFDNYVHDSRCWFRVPWFHEYAPGGYLWPRVVFVGNDERTPWLVDPEKISLDTHPDANAHATAFA